MASTGLETYLNQFWPGHRPGPHSESLQRSPDPTKNLLRAMLPQPETAPKINPSYGAAWVQECERQTDRQMENMCRPMDKYNKCSAVAEIGDRLATVDMGRKFGRAVPPPLFSWGGVSWVIIIINLLNKRTDLPLTMICVSTCRNSLKYTCWPISNEKHILPTRSTSN